jgi:hypothetical protein
MNESQLQRASPAEYALIPERTGEESSVLDSLAA